ncbi:Glycine-rich domain-containing protein [Thalictrum thalictroides]|uniref:Glycine-rich domain-containing protein n=1 Tax=Thalictrum thalictroides TaxID=46969 RepID=A0A7J6VE68_THATH|nr:Glycine-rich domain-containing protein [Thalictrum thalictroides]
MSLVSNGIHVSDISDEKAVFQVSIDLVAAARRHLAFLQTIVEFHWLYNNSSLRQAIRRYDELWMPLLSDLTVGKRPPILLPPLDVQWVWHCHTLNPVSYRRYCQLKYSKILEKPLIHDEGIEEYALNNCHGVWSERYPFEPFELEAICDEKEEEIATNDDIFKEVSKQRSLCSRFSEPYMFEIVFLISAKQRYKEFMCLLQRFKDREYRLRPTLDIQLMLLTHQSYPLMYAEDVKEIEADLKKVAGIWDPLEEGDVEATKKPWEEVFDQPYEKAGAMLDQIVGSLKPPVYWAVSDVDVNSKYKSMEPRFLLELCMFVRQKAVVKHLQEKKMEFLQLHIIRCHKEMIVDEEMSLVPSDTWKKTWHFYCEFGTRGVILELRRRGTNCFKKSILCTTAFLWNDLLRAPCLTVGKEFGKQVGAVASITPPVQAPYLLKCVPDRVTDDSGAMISDDILKMNRYRPQEGRWLSRTVLDHAGRDCFIVRIRVGGGIWRRGGEIPTIVKWEDRIVEVREGSWTYIAGSIGRAPEKVAGTATPKEKSNEQASWSLSTGDELTICRASSGLIFILQNNTSTDHSVRILKGRKMQYQVDDKVHEEEEDAFVTLVRYTPGNPNGRATALINWRLVVVEFLPEEDAVLVLLICMAILRSVADMAGEDMANLLVRRRLKEHKTGMRDWGSIVMHPSMSSKIKSPYSPSLQPWYWNAKAVMAPVEVDKSRQSTINYSPAECGDKLYKDAIIPKSK